MKKQKEKEESIFIQEVKRDIATFKRLNGKDRLQFVYDYYKYKIFVAIFVVFCIFTAGKLLYEGQKPCRLWVCAVLNTEEDCGNWFYDFYKEELETEDDKTPMDLNQDQPFDYDNSYSYLHEAEVMTTISSRRLDFAVCGPDMYSYLLTLNACQDLSKVMDSELVEELKSSEQLLYDTANITQNRDGTLNKDDAVDGWFAVDISDTIFGHTYNDGNEEDAPLYAVIIRENDHMEDCVKLMNRICK